MQVHTLCSDFLGSLDCITALSFPAGTVLRPILGLPFLWMTTFWCTSSLQPVHLCATHWISLCRHAGGRFSQLLALTGEVTPEDVVTAAALVPFLQQALGKSHSCMKSLYSVGKSGV